MVDSLKMNKINEFDPLAQVYDQLVAWAPYDQWVEELVSRLQWHGLFPGARILDVACGTGLSTFPLLRRGFEVTGVDDSSQMLAQARSKARQMNVDVDFIRNDLLKMNLDRRFDAVICMHSGLDYFLDLNRLQQAFDVLRQHTKEGGVLAFDKCLDEPTFYQQSASNCRELTNGRAIFHYDWDQKNKIFQQTCVVIRENNGEAIERTKVVHKMLAVSPDTLIEMMKASGFKVLERPTQFTVSDPGMGIFQAV